jgi:C4-dicarboxylate transporter
MDILIGVLIIVGLTYLLFGKRAAQVVFILGLVIALLAWIS